MIECSCRVLTTADFNRAVEMKREDIEAAGSLKKAVGVVYNAARAHKEHGPNHSCTTCLSWVAERVQQAGYYTNESYDQRGRFKTGKIGACGRSCDSCPMACPQ